MYQPQSIIFSSDFCLHVAYIMFLLTCCLHLFLTTFDYFELLLKQTKTAENPSKY